MQGGAVERQIEGPAVCGPPFSVDRRQEEVGLFAAGQGEGDVPHRGFTLGPDRCPSVERDREGRTQIERERPAENRPLGERGRVEHRAETGFGNRQPARPPVERAFEARRGGQGERSGVERQGAIGVEAPVAVLPGGEAKAGVGRGRQDRFGGGHFGDRAAHLCPQPGRQGGEPCRQTFRQRQR